MHAHLHVLIWTSVSVSQEDPVIALAWNPVDKKKANEDVVAICVPRTTCDHTSVPSNLLDQRNVCLFCLMLLSFVCCFPRHLGPESQDHH